MSVQPGRTTAYRMRGQHECFLLQEMMLTLNYSLRSLYLGTGDRIILSFFWAGVTSCSGASSGTSEYICSAMGHLSPWKLEEDVYSDSGVVVRVCLITLCSLGPWLMLPQQRMTHNTDSIRGNITFSVSCLRLII